MVLRTEDITSWSLLHYGKKSCTVSFIYIYIYVLYANMSLVNAFAISAIVILYCILLLNILDMHLRVCILLKVDTKENIIFRNTS